MIIVTGATGQLGRAVVERLLERVPAGQVGISVRDPNRADALAGRGVRVRRGDFGDPESLRGAFEGASQVLIVSVNTPGEAGVRQNRTAIDAARDAGARRILYTSHMGVNPASLFAPMHDHAATEAALQASGVAYTSLRNGFYASTVVQLMGPALATGQFAAPPDGPVSWTTHADLAEATALILADEGRLDGLTPPLTGPEALDFAALAAIASDLRGRTIQRETVSDDEYRAGMVARGAPDVGARMLLGMFAASRQGEFAAVDPTLADLLGRPPATMREVLASTTAT